MFTKMSPGSLDLITGLSIFTVLRIFSALAVMALPVRVATITGDSVEGNFIAINGEELIVETKDGQKRFKFDDLQSVEHIEADEGKAGPKLRVTLLGGSQVAVQDISIDKETLRFEPRRQAPVEVPLRLVQSVRLRAASVTTDPQWLGMLGEKNRSDLLVIRRANGELDPFQGVIKGVADGKVEFTMAGDDDDETLKAPFEKLEGIIFGGNRKVQTGNIQVRDIWGSRWVASAISPGDKDDPLALELSGNVTHEIPLEHIQSIFWSGGFQLLSGMKPTDATYEPYLKTAADSDLLQSWFGPRADGSDLIVAGSGVLEYRVSQEFTTLAGAAKRDGSVAKASDVILRVLVDDKEVWSQKLVGNEPRGFELSVAKARQVRFVVDSDNDGDLGDIIRITRPRLLK